MDSEGSADEQGPEDEDAQAVVGTGIRDQHLVVSGWFASHADTGTPGAHVHLSTNDRRDPVLRTNQIPDLVDALHAVGGRIDRMWEREGATWFTGDEPDDNDPDVIRQRRIDALVLQQNLRTHFTEISAILLASEDARRLGCHRPTAGHRRDRSDLPARQHQPVRHDPCAERGGCPEAGRPAPTTVTAGDGYRWLANPPPGAPQAEDGDERRVVGSVIRFMWDHGCGVPLWDEDGPLPDDPDWLAAELGVSRTLVGDMAAWVAEEDARTIGPAHTHQAAILFARLRAEVPARFTLLNRESRRH